MLVQKLLRLFEGRSVSQEAVTKDDIMVSKQLVPRGTIVFIDKLVKESDGSISVKVRTVSGLSDWFRFDNAREFSATFKLLN